MRKRYSSKECIIITSYGGGLEVWRKAGLLLRAIKIIKFFSPFYDKIWLFTYDPLWVKEFYRNYLPNNVVLIPKPKILPKPLHSLITPIFKAQSLKATQIIRTWQLWGCWTALILKLILRKKLLLRQGFQFSKFAARRGKMLYYLARIVEAIGYKLSDMILVTTRNDYQYILSSYRVSEKKVKMVPNPIDVELFKPLNHVPKKAGRIIFVGRLVKQKNILSLIKAIKNLPEVTLYICGDGPLKKKLQEMQAPNIKLLGVIPQKKLPEELNKSQVFVLPSFYEGHPKALLEAMACGLPVIGSDVEGIRDLIIDGINGLLCKPTPEDIREKIIMLLSDEKLREKIGKNAREYVVRNFSFEKILSKELELHRKLLSTFR